jgi:hypothetical protein
MSPCGRWGGASSGEAWIPDRVRDDSISGMTGFQGLQDFTDARLKLSVILFSPTPARHPDLWHKLISHVTV